MYSPKLRPQMDNRQVIIKSNNEASYCNTIRICLIVWAFLRSAVSLLWTGTITLATVGQLLSPDAEEPPSRLLYGAFAIMIQLVEFGMLVTFIVAGFKKSAKLYLVYYRYCILTLFIFVISVALCLSLGYEHGHYFGEPYLFYHIYDVAGVIGNDELAFLIASIFDVAFEILLIFLIKMLIKNYSYYGNNNAGSENV